jgi:hypothetical protein
MGLHRVHRNQGNNYHGSEADEHNPLLFRLAAAGRTISGAEPIEVQEVIQSLLGSIDGYQGDPVLCNQSLGLVL